MNKRKELRLERSNLKKLKIKEEEDNFKIGLKRCTKCKELKPLEQFTKFVKSKDGLYRLCKECKYKIFKKWYTKDPEIRKKKRSKYCSENRDRVNATCLKWRKNNPEKYIFNTFKSRLKIKYKLTVEQVNEMLKKQNNKCPICNRSFDIIKKTVDHNHLNEKIRSILCHQCNSGLGFFDDNIERLNNAINYLNFHSNSQ